MNGAYYDPQSGVFTGVVAGGPSLQWLQDNGPAGMAVWLYDWQRPDPLRWRVQGGALVDYQPPAPADTDDLVWSWDSDAWRWVSSLSVGAAQRKMCLAIEIERDRRRYLPLIVAGVMWQADAESQGLIAGALVRLVRGNGLPDPWIGWRDADNEMHWADLPAEGVRTQLEALSSAIEDRESALRIATWQKKAEVRALPDVASINSYDVMAGWP